MLFDWFKMSSPSNVQLEGEKLDKTYTVLSIC